MSKSINVLSLAALVTTGPALTLSAAAMAQDAATLEEAQVSYRITDAIDVALGVDNLFDKDAPYVASWTDGNTDTMTYDLLGRRWYLRASWNLQ